MSSYSQITLEVTRRLSKAEKKEYGFFVTPPSIIGKLITQIQSLYSSRSFTNILEPSCGTCEFLSAVSKIYLDSHVDGIEWNKTVYDSINGYESDRIHLIHEDFLKYNKPESYDLVIGNPPYFVFQKEQVPMEYREYITGRPNIFTVFILHSLAQLKSGGVLAFVLPKSFLNSAYYEEIRIFIKKTCIIKDLLDFEECNDFLETQQATFGLIVEKKGNNEDAAVESNFCSKIGDNFIFVTNPDSFSRLIKNTTTLKALGYSVKTGSIVWNEKKKNLTNDSTKTLLIYNSNVVDNKIEIKTFSNDEKKQFIDLPGLSRNSLVVNRGNGNSVYKLSYAFVDSSREYLVENHLNVITHPTNIDFSGIIKSFQDPRTTEFLRTIIGNGALSKTELETMLPIYLD